MLMSISIMYFIGLYSFLINRYFMMMILLSIEFMYMSLLLLLCVYFSLFNILSVFIFLITIVCEAALGMSLLVMMSFFYGNEMMKSISLIKC
nr:NADH dehydrogenase subunit 4L [Dermacentor (Indocentor) sp.]